jgi:hypothetical protein
LDLRLGSLSFRLAFPVQDMQKLRERGATALFTPFANELHLGMVVMLVMGELEPWLCPV